MKKQQPKKPSREAKNVKVDVAKHQERTPSGGPQSQCGIQLMACFSGVHCTHNYPTHSPSGPQSSPLPSWCLLTYSLGKVPQFQ